MNKIRKFLTFLTLLIIFFIGINTEHSLAMSLPWDGKTIDVSWFDEKTYDTTTEYTINTPEELMGLAAIVNGIYNPGIKVIGDNDSTKIVPEEHDRVLIIPFDNSYGNVRWGKYDFEGKTIKLGDDIDMGGKFDENTGEWDKNSPNYMPIGGAYCLENDDPKRTLISSSFNGNFDGQGHIVENIYCERFSPDHFGFSQGIGFIGVTGNNNKQQDVRKDNKQKHEIPKGSTIKNIIIGKGYFSGRRMVGGVVGKAGDSTDGIKIINCANESDIKATDKKGVGGILGSSWSHNVEVSYCYNRGTVINTGGFIVGGIVGSNDGTIKNCFNTGIVRSTRNGRDVVEQYVDHGDPEKKLQNSYPAADITKVVGTETSYVENCYWIENEYNKDRIGASTYNQEGGTVKNISKVSIEEAKTEEFVKKLNNGSNIFKFVPNSLPKLAQEIRLDKNVKISIKNPENTEIVANKSGEVRYGSNIELNIKEKPGIKVDYFTVNGEKINGNTVIADKDMEISVVLKKAEAYKLKYNESQTLNIDIKKTGLVFENGEYRMVENYAIRKGDNVFEGDKLFISVASSNDQVKNVKIEPISGIIVVSTDFGKTSHYLVDEKKIDEKNKIVELKFTEQAKKANWSDYGDTKWYDNNPNAEIFTLKDHYDLAGLSKIVNSTEGKYKDVDFKGKTIKLSTDIRMRNDKNKFEGENLPFEPIGIKKPFAGTFDGNNFAISGILINENGEKGGLFYNIKGDINQKANIKNLTLLGEIDLKSYDIGIGSLASNTEHCNISNVKSYVNIVENGKSIIGGIIGIADNTKIENCKNIGNISSANGCIGGLVGKLEKTSSIVDSENIGEIYRGPVMQTESDVLYSAGGIIGYNEGEVSRVTNKGEIIGHGYIGGIVGYSKKGIKESYSTGNIGSIASSNPDYSLGTLIGKIENIDLTIDKTYTTGKLFKENHLNSFTGYIGNEKFRTNYKDSYYLAGTFDNNNREIIEKDSEYMKSDEFINKLSSVMEKDIYNINGGYPVLKFENRDFENINIEKLVKNSKDEIEKYPMKENYTKENLVIVNKLIDDYSKKLNSYSVNNIETKKDLRNVVELFKQEVDKIEKIEKNQDVVDSKVYKKSLEETLKALKERIENKKLILRRAEESVEEAKDLIPKADRMLNLLEQQKEISVVDIKNMIMQMSSLIKDKLPLDEEPPKIFINDPNITIKDKTYDNAFTGVLVTDNYRVEKIELLSEDPNVKIELMKVIFPKDGTYTLTYKATDYYGNIGKETRTVVVKSESKIEKEFDLNKDGKIDGSDVLYLKEKLNTNNLKDLKLFDLNEDGVINVHDIVFLEQNINKN